MTSIKWTPSGKRFASGGADRKVKIWEIYENGPQPSSRPLEPSAQCGVPHPDRHDKVATLSGCNQSVMGLDFDENEAHVLAASNDFTTRLWSLADQRQRVERRLMP